MSGWVKLHRSLATSAIVARPEYLAVWVHLLLKATHKPIECLVGRRIVALLPGQMVFGRVGFSKKIGVSESVLRGALTVLEQLGQITIKTTTKFSIISITNWHKYQEDSPANDQQMTSKSPANDHKQEVQEVQEVKAKIKSIYAQDKPERSKNIRSGDLIKLGVSEQHAKDWLAIRKQKRLPPTQTALNTVIREADKAGLTLAQAIQCSAEEGWAGFKADWYNKKCLEGEVTYDPQSTRGSTANLSLVDQVRERNRQREQERSGNVGGDDGFRTFDGEIVGADD